MIRKKYILRKLKDVQALDEYARLIGMPKKREVKPQPRDSKGRFVKRK